MVQKNYLSKFPLASQMSIRFVIRNLFCVKFDTFRLQRFENKKKTSELCQTS